MKISKTGAEFHPFREKVEEIAQKVLNQMKQEDLSIDQTKLRSIQNKLAKLKECCFEESKGSIRDNPNYYYSSASGYGYRAAASNKNYTNFKMIISKEDTTTQNEVKSYTILNEIIKEVTGIPRGHVLYIKNAKGEMTRKEVTLEEMENLMDWNSKRRALVITQGKIKEYFKNKKTNLVFANHYNNFINQLIDVTGGANDGGIRQEVFEYHYQKYCHTKQAMLNDDISNQNWAGIRKFYFARDDDNLTWQSGGDIGTKSVKSFDVGRAGSFGTVAVRVASKASLQNSFNELNYLFSDAKTLNASMIADIMTVFTQTIENAASVSDDEANKIIEKEVNRIINRLKQK